MRSGDLKENEQTLKTCTELMDQAMNSLRRTCFDLMPSGLEEGRIKGALIALKNKIELGSTIRLNISGMPDTFPFEPKTNISIYRILQEFINNSIKHSNCSIINIITDFTSDALSLTILDNGIGINDLDENRNSRGLRTMKSRIQSLNGEYSFSSSSNEGTRLSMKFKF